MADADYRCAYWKPGACEGSPHCPPRCPRFVDSDGEPWLVRPAVESDRDALVDLYADASPSDRVGGRAVPPGGRTRIAEWLADLVADGCDVVAVRDGHVVGHALYAPTDAAEPELTAFVRPGYRRRGIGTELAKHVAATAAAADRDALAAVTDADDDAGRGLCECLGFEIVEQFSYERRDGGVDALRLRLPLSDSLAEAFQCPPIFRGDDPEP
ncbi:GNAT family N-acetyltransferase [Halomicrobium salinisoli]|uniref:GNAT family N-acetyltransferase n=1 Tax=Halomicrobium salinisoli TaxID=2878391 RepID=UPI001CF03BD3|nr:GNAT family N-acetyltransferase [Halomicrobium salinisoli]